MERIHNTQVAPWPSDLEVLVTKLRYRKHEGWRVFLEHDTSRDKVDGVIVGHGLTLVVTTKGYDTYHPEDGTNYRVNHYFIVPAATYNREAWARWLFEQLAKVEIHECMENFIIDNERPFAPLHGPGCDPYTVHQYATDIQKRTKFTGEVLDA